MPEKDVVIYTVPAWPRCAKAKEYLSEKKIPYKEYNVVADRAAAKKMIIKSQQKTVPVIVVNDRDFVVGFDPAKLNELFSPDKE